ncbi:MAG: hypothetical protein R3253_08135 [Longimicrobiales bacterium]|nr:hypothetical protein [Longimicrobiales bacterium]
MEILWVLLPGPFVGYLIIDSVRKIFSDDKELLIRVFKAQPITMFAAATALGSVAVWGIAEVVLRFL